MITVLECSVLQMDMVFTVSDGSVAAGNVGLSGTNHVRFVCIQLVIFGAAVEKQRLVSHGTMRESTCLCCSSVSSVSCYHLLTSRVHPRIPFC